MPWNDNLWLILAANGIQPADSPGRRAGLVRRGLLEVNVSPDPLGGLRSRRTRPRTISAETKNIPLLEERPATDELDLTARITEPSPPSDPMYYRSNTRLTKPLSRFYWPSLTLHEAQ